jgi:YD repeat-containing protein
MECRGLNERVEVNLGSFRFAGVPPGLAKKKYGSRDYPVEYTYDPQGRLKTQTTWTNFAGAGGAAVTTWHFHPERGWITNKVYADGKGTKYTRTDAGRPLTRLWARGTNTTYTYNTFGDLSDTTYTGTGTPTVTQTYTRRGQLGKVVRDGITTTLFYTTAGQLLSESFSGGTLNDLRVT